MPSGRVRLGANDEAKWDDDEVKGWGAMPISHADRAGSRVSICRCVLSRKCIQQPVELGSGYQKALAVSWRSAW